MAKDGEDTACSPSGLGTSLVTAELTSLVTAARVVVFFSNYFQVIPPPKLRRLTKTATAGSRTRVPSLEGWDDNRYTTVARFEGHAQLRDLIRTC